MPRYLDTETWSRRAAFEFFLRYDDPFYNICAPVDVTELLAVCGRSGVSFATASLHAVMKAVNASEPFRYRLEDGRVVVHERIHPATTVLLEEDRLAFLYFDHAEELQAFSVNAAAARAALEGRGAMDDRRERTDVIHFSSLPWISFTSISHARRWGGRDSIPKITTGRYQRVGERFTMPISVEVHHALVDGVHVARFLEHLQRCLSGAGATDEMGGEAAAGAGSP